MTTGKGPQTWVLRLKGQANTPERAKTWWERQEAGRTAWPFASNTMFTCPVMPADPAMKVRFRDVMVKTGDGLVLNRASVGKWGLRVGTWNSPSNARRDHRAGALARNRAQPAALFRTFALGPVRRCPCCRLRLCGLAHRRGRRDGAAQRAAAAGAARRRAAAADRGDSTGVGTGASSPRNSLAGLIARDHPRLRIDNRARDGATLADVVAQLAGEERYDVILVQAGQ